VEESANGSDNLEKLFEGNLRRIGRMVAILDTWDQPLYLSRVWTVYEQFVASTLQIQAPSGPRRFGSHNAAFINAAAIPL
jgi:hypothetical protein